MSSKKYGPTLIVDLGPPPLQILLIIITHSLALWALSLCDLPFKPQWSYSIFQMLVVASAIVSLYRFRSNRIKTQKLLVHTDGRFLLDDGGIEVQPIRISSVGSRGRYMMVLVLLRDQNRSTHLITPGAIGEALYRQLRVRLAIQPELEANAPTYWQRIFQRA